MELSAYLPYLRIDKDRIFDPIRKKWLKIQPEELVRQTLIIFLINEKKLPLNRLAVEKAIRVHNQLRRFDIVYYNQHGKPVLLVECKSPKTALTETVLEQAVWYNFKIGAPYLLLSNGSESKWFEIDNREKTYKIMNDNGPDLMHSSF